MNIKTKNQSINRRESLRNRLRRNDLENDHHLNLLLEKSEDEIDLANVITALKDNSKNIQYLPLCSQLLTKFTNKALQILERTQEWSYEIKLILKEYEINYKNPPYSLYFAQFKCLTHLSVSDPEAELSINKAIALETDESKQIDLKLELATYYENSSQYQKMKKILDQSEILCKRNPNLDQQLAMTWLFLGHYYFYRFQFQEARDYMNQAKNLLEIICKQEKKENIKILGLFGNCLHYLGRVYFAQYDFVTAAQLYIKSQQMLEIENFPTNKSTLADSNPAATGFYHLRLGQVLEACQLIESADYHYQQSQKLFLECGAASGLMQVSLIRANLIGSYVDNSTFNKKSILEKQVEQIKNAAKDAQAIGYNRGYLEALLRLLFLYLKYGKILDLIKVCFAIVTASEFYQLINPNTFMSGFQLAIGLYGMGPYYIAKLYQKQKHKPRTILKVCPCHDPECRKLR
ncbi:hypothetical protein PL11201_440010 [Planktothrix sp. PCC 11201]|uniref:hypothetical protein n=1 Tax=Planktothrix sp. PCC 11201 TaxID=1729650 RepID=UPI000921FA65|nr:hypothetical protein [Planktothrix sp. PCC 11201]SKB12786.1 hypothetical protein PL11201_440010 [Planktothrix sp. PCC 11201]